MDPMNSDSSSGPSSDRPAPRSRRLAGGLTLAMLASWFLMLSPLPYALFSGVTGLVALVLLILLIIRAIREKRYPMAVLGTLLGVPALLLIIANASLSAAFYGPMAELEQCRATAITEQAQVQCRAAAEGSMAEWVSGLLGG